MKVDEQTARLMIIHQMLGTRISDTLTLRTDCLIEKGNEVIIRINQPKSHYYEKPISMELASLIKAAIKYTKEKSEIRNTFLRTKTIRKFPGHTDGSVTESCVLFTKKIYGMTTDSYLVLTPICTDTTTE